MRVGSVEYVVIAFPGNHFKGEIIPALKELVDRDLVRIAAMQAAQAAPAYTPPAAPAPAVPTAMSMDEKIAKLEKMAELQKAGILTEAEFAAQKAAILAA